MSFLFKINYFKNNHCRACQWYSRCLHSIAQAFDHASKHCRTSSKRERPFACDCRHARKVTIWSVNGCCRSCWYLCSLSLFYFDSNFQQQTNKQTNKQTNLSRIQWFALPNSSKQFGTCSFGRRSSWMHCRHQKLCQSYANFFT